MPAGNLLLSAGLILTGATYERFKEWASLINLKIMGETTFYNIQSSIICPVIHQSYTLHKESLIAACGGEPVHVAGDGRCDSPGFSAKYCTYSLMEVRFNI